MIECVLLGDSIALGVARSQPSCQVQAVSGIGTGSYLSRFSHTVHARHALISIGSNDPASGDLVSQMRTMRSRIIADEVTWLLSANNAHAAAAARAVAAEHGDRVINIMPFLSSDRVHPTPAGYYRLSSMWRK